MKQSYNKSLAGLLPAASQAGLSGLTLFKHGRTKELYDLGETLLVVHTDRVAGGPGSEERIIPGKGQVVNQMSAYWFQRLREVFPNHLVSAELCDFPESCQAHAEYLEGRSMLVKKATPLPVKCLVRGYLTGAGWQEYQTTGGMAGTRLPSGMLESQRLPVPLFVPDIEGAAGEAGFASLEALYGKVIAEKLRSAALHLYFKAWKIARYRGLLIAESSFEFGLHEGSLLLIDECITPYTSQFWPLESYQSGGPLPALDPAGLLASLRGRAGM